MRLLAFGDSLTAGYHSMGAAFSPWAPLLCKHLGIAAVDHVGMSGFTTTQLLATLDEETVTDVVPREWPGLRWQLRNGGPYSVVLIMAGTNDLADKTPTATILANLAALHGVAHAASARTVAMTIPESHAAHSVGWLGRARDEANEAIRTWARAQPAEQVLLVEAAEIVPFSRHNGLWERDGLHMSAAGYMAFGRGLVPLVAPLVSAVSSGGSGRGGSSSTADSVAVAAPTASSGWHIGAAVRLQGLVKAAQHNGKTGRLRRVPADSMERVTVALDGADGEGLLVKRENLKLLAAAQQQQQQQQQDVLDVD